MIGVAAGETRDPQTQLPKAINRVAGRILLFYVGAVAIILMLIPWSSVSTESSPFVQAWGSLGIAAAAGILNAVVLTSALSSSNSGVYTTARMGYALAGSGHAPKRFHALSRRRVPAAALAASAAALGLGVFLNAAVPEKAFGYITSVATVGVLWVWGIIVVTHLRYRRQERMGLVPRQSYRMPGSPWTNYVVLAYIALVAVLLAVEPGQRVALVAGAVWAIILIVGWRMITRPRPTFRAEVAAENH